MAAEVGVDGCSPGLGEMRGKVNATVWNRMSMEPENRKCRGRMSRDILGMVLTFLMVERNQTNRVWCGSVAWGEKIDVKGKTNTKIERKKIAYRSLGGCLAWISLILRLSLILTPILMISTWFFVFCIIFFFINVMTSRRRSREQEI
jgi:hypothetical protein